MTVVEPKSVLVTGGTRGIGWATANAFAAAGADVVITYRSDEFAARDLAAKLERDHSVCAYAVHLDLTAPATVSASIEAAAAFLGGQITTVVNNAGYADMSMPAFETVSGEVLEQTLATNVAGPFRVAQAAVPHMPDGGAIVNIGSCLGYRVPGGGLTSYAMSKAAVSGFTRGLARDLGPRGIRVNEIAPGSIDTDMNPADGPSADYQRSQIILARYGRPEEVAAVAVFLAGEQASFITGSVIPVDGGANT